MIPKILLYLCSSVVLLYSELSASPTVYIYAGPGVSQISLKQTEHTFHSILKSDYKIERIYPEQIIHDDWEKNAALLIIPGGADCFYQKALNGLGNQRIRSYVEKGGAYLGLCAGAYYAGNYVDFAKGTEIEVQAARDLSFFPGIVRGPNLAPYVYKSERGARTANIIWMDSPGFPKNTVFTVYYNGGGYFVDANKTKNTTVLACYDTENREAAIVECQVGLGKAILSGVHFEFDPQLMDAEDENLRPIILNIKNANTQRLQLIQHILTKLKLKL